MFCFLGVTALHGQGESATTEELAATVQHLGQQLLQTYGIPTEKTAPSGAVAAEGDPVDVAGTRLRALSRLVFEDPHRALSLAWPSEIVAELRARAPRLDPHLEKWGAWQGEATPIYVDSIDLKFSRLIYAVRLDDDYIEASLASPSAPPGRIESGDRLMLTGVRAGHRVAVSDWRVESHAEDEVCSTVGEQRVAVLLTHSADEEPPQNIDPDEIRSNFFGPAESLDDYWREASYGQTWASGDVFGWFALDREPSCDSTGAVLEDAIQAADATVDFQNYQRIFVLFPATDCWFGGQGTVGCGRRSSPGDGEFPASTSWIPYPREQPFGNRWGIYAHEAGHNLGLLHASSLGFDTEPVGPPLTEGEHTEYGDRFSMMGSVRGHYNAPHKTLLSPHFQFDV